MNVLVISCSGVKEQEGALRSNYSTFVTTIFLISDRTITGLFSRALNAPGAYVQVSNHDELMCKFFAQADALAVGKTEDELRMEGVPENLVPHKTFSGNRPSMSLLLGYVTAYSVGQLLALYENRTGARSLAIVLCDSVKLAPTNGK